MCTAVSYKGSRHLFGRTLDLEYHYGEQVMITPRNSPIVTRHAGEQRQHYAIIGIAECVSGHPLYYDAVNEHGLCMAGLNFPGCTFYHPIREGETNIASFELIPWVLGQCRSAAEASGLLEKVSICETGFSDELPATPLHWMLADGEECIVIEPMEGGVSLTRNPVRVMTNSPSFDKHLFNLNNYLGVSCEPAANSFAEGLELQQYSRGMGGLGLPGDYSSSSRFVRAAFALHNSICPESSGEVVQFFHILDTVAQPRGCVRVMDGHVCSVYSSCCDAQSGIYYLKTYDNPTVYCVDMHRENIDGDTPVGYPVFHDFTPVPLN